MGMSLIPLVIIGAGGLGREVAWLVDEVNQDKPTYEFLGFLDDGATDTVEGYAVVGTTDEGFKIRTHKCRLCARWVIH